MATKDLFKIPWPALPGLDSYALKFFEGIRDRGLGVSSN